MTSPPLRRHDLLRMAAAQQAERPQAEPALTWPALPAVANDTARTLQASPPISPPGTPPTASPTPAFAPPSTSTRTRQRPTLPPLLRWASRIDALPPALWMSLQALALWPVLRWAVQRFASDPAALLALLPLSLLAIAAARGRLSCNWPARPGWLAASAVLSMAVTASIGVLSWPELAGASALAAGCSWASFRKPGTPVLPVLGLLLFSLPLEMPALLHLFKPKGLFALPVWLLWLALCTACALALWNRLADLRFLARLPAVVLAAAMGCLLHLCVLVSWEISNPNAIAGINQAGHATLILLSSTAVCAMVLGLMRSEVRDATR